VQPATGIGEFDFSTTRRKQGHAEFAFEGLHRWLTALVTPSARAAAVKLDRSAAW